MQRIRLDRGRIIFLIISLSLLAGLVAIDLVTKSCFCKSFFDKGETDTVVIPNFFYFTYVENTGAAFSFLADKEWSQTLFKILTVIISIVFIGVYVYAVLNNKKFLGIIFIVILAGAFGNFYDRMVFGYVRDFIGFIFGSYKFPVFNVADICLTVGVALYFVWFFFLDKNAIFKRKNGKEDKPTSDA